jgi:competence ComEA-like helix-hairpin-helix protein
LVPTANEKKALWFLAIVALSGSAVRLWRANLPPASSADSSALERQIGRVDSVRALRHGKARPRADRGRDSVTAAAIDLDRATAGEIERLPGIGPALSQRIVAARDSLGSFGQIEALCEVNGVGSKLVEKLRPLVTFTGARRPLSDTCGDASKRSRKTRVGRTREAR